MISLCVINLNKILFGVLPTIYFMSFEDVRLMNGRGPFDGRVEFYNGTDQAWQAVCEVDATAVCRRLGWYDGQDAGNAYGQGSGPACQHAGVICGKNTHSRAGFYRTGSRFEPKY